MRESIIRGFFIFYLLLLVESAYPNEICEKKLEKNIERMNIENYYYSGESCWRIYSIIFVYCNGSYYLLYDTNLDHKTIGYKRYFSNIVLKEGAKIISMDISDERLSLDDFIEKYLIKKEKANYYNVSIIYDLFITPADILPILLSAQYNYDFLILGENNMLKLYLPSNYPNIKKRNMHK